MGREGKGRGREGRESKGEGEGFHPLMIERVNLLTFSIPCITVVCNNSGIIIPSNSLTPRCEH
jgi:hypothetical protein